MYTHIPFLADLLPTLHSIPPQKVITEYWAECPVLYSHFPLVICLSHSIVYMLVLLSQLVSSSPSPCVHMSVLYVYEVRFLSTEKSWEKNLNQDTVNKACRKKRLSWTMGIIFLPLNQFLKKLKLSFNFKWCFPSAFDFSKAITLGKKRVKVKVLISQLCPTLCDPMDCSLPGSFFHGIPQARILELVAIPFSRGSSHPGIEPRSPVLQADSLPGKKRYHLKERSNLLITFMFQS